MKQELSLPKNRFEVFMDVMKNSWRTLVNISLILGLFSLPIILVVIFSRLVGLEILQNINLENSDEVITATVQYFNHNVFSIIIIIPAAFVCSIGFAGAFNMMKHLVWNERVEYLLDLKKAVKGNISKIIFNAILITIIYTVIIFIHLYTTFINVSLIEKSLILIVCILLITVIFIFLFYGYSQMVVYENKLFNFIKNNLIFTFVKFLRNVGITLLMLVISLVGFLFSDVVGIVIAYSFYVLIGFGIAILLFVLNSFENFDRIINKLSYPQIYKKGMEGEKTCHK